MPILGIDEVGRGPLAGPLVIGAVILPEKEKPWFNDLKDSKKLTAKKRESLNKVIVTESTTSLGWVAAEELDKLGITESLRLATRRAVKQIQSLHTPFSQIIIDGNINFLTNTPLEKYTSTCIKGDSKIREISAASIIAKVARDHYMIELSTKYPNYGFDKHVGYGTKTHREAIYKYGLTPEHRHSFEPCKSISNFISPTKNTKNTTNIGKKAESIVAEYLKSQGHTIIEQNHKTPYYEIDIISTKDDKIYFTEVKYRKNAIHGNGLDAITTAKLRQMHFAAESYLKFNKSKFQNYQPLLAVASVTDLNYQIQTWFPLP
ncbi:ribonuclease HII [Candidatus Saccharibacteria bacterium]|nr:ribonuclease HII [Candidatus Saccharibacteria bacterium]